MGRDVKQLTVGQYSLPKLLHAKAPVLLDTDVGERWELERGVKNRERRMEDRGGDLFYFPYWLHHLRIQ